MVTAAECFSIANTAMGARAKEITSNNEIYDGSQLVQMMGIDLPPQLARMRTVVNWPRLAVDSIAERQIVRGFRVAGDADNSDKLWNWWQLNNLDQESRLAHVEAMVQGIAYIVVGQSDDGKQPVITVESADRLCDGQRQLVPLLARR